MAWNKPSEAPKPVQKKPSALRGLVAGLVVVALAAVAFFLFSGKDSPKPGREGAKKTRIREVTPAAAPKAEIAVTNAPAVTNDAQKIAKTPANMLSGLPPGARIMTLMDGTVVTNIPPRAIFKRPFENILAGALRPTGTGRTLLLAVRQRFSDEEFIKMLKEKFPPEDDDPEEVRKCKEDVQQLKDDILAELKGGRSLDDVFAGIAHQHSLDQMTRVQTLQMQAEAIRSGDAESVRTANEAANQIRKQRGLEELELPKKYVQQDDWSVTPQEETDAEDDGEEADGQ